MIKNIRNIVLSLLLFLTACSDDVYVEGLQPSAKSYAINKSVPVTHGNIATCQLQIEGDPYSLSLQVSRMKIVAANTSFAVNDSALVVSLYSTQLQVETKSNGINRYGRNELMNAGEAFASAGPPLLAAVKKPPYTGSYTAMQQYLVARLSFSIGQDGYIAFKTTKNGLTGYGWLHVTVDEKNIVFDRYGYQMFEQIRAGQE